MATSVTYRQPPILTHVWQLDVLRALGAKPTAQNIRLLNSWWLAEGGDVANKAKFNWLNTTWGKEEASGTINSVGVRAFPNYETGLKWTVISLLNVAPGTVAALKTGNPYSSPQYRSGSLQEGIGQWLAGSNWRQKSGAYINQVVNGSGALPASWKATEKPKLTIGSGFFSGIEGALGTIKKYDPDPITNPTGFLGATERGIGAAGSLLGHTPVIGGELKGAANLLKAPFTAANAVGKAVAWIFDQKNLVRVGYVLAGSLLIGAGLVLMARSVGAPLPSGLPRSAGGRTADDLGAAFEQGQQAEARAEARKAGRRAARAERERERPEPKPRADFGKVPY